MRLQQLEVDAFLAEGRRILDYQWRRGDAFERKGLGVLVFTGVIIALLPATINAVVSLEGWFRTAALCLGGLTVIALLGAAGSAAGVLWARDSRSVNLAEIQQAWADCVARAEKGEGYSDAWQAVQVKRNLAEMLLHGVSQGPSPVQSLCDDADRRGRWFGWAVKLNLCALSLMLTITVITTAGKVDMSDDKKQQDDPPTQTTQQTNPRLEKKEGQQGGTERRG